MVVNDFCDEDGCDLCPVEAPVTFDDWRIFVWSENESVWMCQFERQLIFAIAHQFMTSARKGLPQVIQARCGIDVVETRSQFAGTYLTELPNGLRIVTADAFEFVVREEDVQ